jgi:LmbE family N-acetylglucosaminyl deacetylase
MMKILALSPHLDDAVFSAGALLARLAESHEVVVHTLLTGGSHPASGFALACQLDKGLSPDTDYMALRREEDRAAAGLLGVAAAHHLLLEAPHRGYETPAALFDAQRADDPLPAQLHKLLPELLKEADLVLAPYGFGNHIDHVIVRQAAEAAAASKLLLWRDLPYAARLTEPLEGWRAVSSAETLEAKVAACLAYRSQIGFQFGSDDAARRAIESDFAVMGGELFLTLSAEAQERTNALFASLTEFT